MSLRQAINEMMMNMAPSRFGKSALVLLLSNVFTIIVAVFEQWKLSDLMWIYWGQSVVIGFYNWRRMCSLKQFSTEGFTVNDQPVSPTRATQHWVATFFVMHYGLFHFVYFLFLCAERTDSSTLDILSIVICIAVFGANHRFSFHYNRDKDLSRKPNIGRIMFFPYARILPMHLTIMFGSHCSKHSMGTLILFLSLKTFADLLMHLIEHHETCQPAS